MIYLLVLLSFVGGDAFTIEPQAKFLSMESCQAVAARVAATDFVRCVPYAGSKILEEVRI